MELKCASSKRPGAVATILVAERNEAIRTAIAGLLEAEGYDILEAETLFEAEPVIDNSGKPLVLVVGDADGFADTNLQYFTAVAANPVTGHAYLYLMTAPLRERLPGLVEALSAQGNLGVDKPHELALFLAVVAHAAELLRA